ncbi:MAG: hypothetical protein JSW11_19900 [Candidatus Heimdallarchaeota archaeon]|nr:MAG: hypothetical protein JSW11_19900 [Candidatus Heimdallarchaeota archaeon]
MANLPESKPNCLDIARMRHLGAPYQVEGIVAAADVVHQLKQNCREGLHDSDNLGSSLVT